ncbi:hypothetical protein GCM10027072_38490 [Streptomyces bullii]
MRLPAGRPVDRPTGRLNHGPADRPRTGPQADPGPADRPIAPTGPADLRTGGGRTGWWADRLAGRRNSRPTGGPIADRPTGWRAARLAGRPAGGPPGWPADRLAGRPAGRPTGWRAAETTTGVGGRPTVDRLTD